MNGLLVGSRVLGLEIICSWCARRARLQEQRNGARLCRSETVLDATG